MIVRLNKKIEYTYCNPFIIERSSEEKCNIYNYWNKYVQSKNSYNCFNGDVFLVTDISFSEKSFILEIGQGKYSELIYAQQTGKLQINSLFVASYIITSDNYLGFVMDNGDRVNTIGGMADRSDFDNGTFKPENCLMREFKEELGVDPYDKSLFYSVSAKYLKIANEDEQKLPLFPIGILYEVSTILTKAELQEQLQVSKGQAKEKSINPVFYGKKDYTQLEQHKNKVSYILELFNSILKEE